MSGRLRRVFTVAYAGGDENAYRALAQHAEELEVVPLERPWRGRRMSEPLRHRVDVPYVVYGHSLGARLAFLLCRRVRAEGLPSPHLVVSGASSPSVPSRERDTWRLTGDAFWAHLDRLGGLPPQLRQFDDLMAHYEPVLRPGSALLGDYVVQCGGLRMCTMPDGLGFSLTQLRCFVVSAEVGNISEAAEKLCASQSAVSAAVMRLERQLGVQLLLRHHARGVTLTPSGRHLLREARTLLGQARNLKAQGDALAGDIAGQVDIGLFSPIAPFLLPLVYRMARERNVAIQLNVHEASADQLLEFLRDGLCELAITYDFLSGDYEFRPLVDLPIYALLADGDTLGKSGAIGLDELSDLPLVTLNIPRVLRHFEKLFADAGVPMPKVITTTTLETMRGLVAAGFGFALMYQQSSTVTTLDGGKVRAVEISGDAPSSSLGVAMMPYLNVSRRNEALLEVLASVVSISYGAN